MGFIKLFLSLVINALSSLLLIYCVMSWFVPPDFPLRQWLDGFMNQLLDPIRKILPSFGMFDLSPIILMLVLQFLQRIVNRF
ncbi:MAG: YggT family protein [Anaerolineaceae bacterium]|nr:YggT family protein [Anaerolineaceae bacterium]